jgi:hypothetical protein
MQIKSLSRGPLIHVYVRIYEQKPITHSFNVSVLFWQKVYENMLLFYVIVIDYLYKVLIFF